ncbi:hypothetical protein HYP06_gp090 [Vibrio phage vB_VspP_pVa5]|uniref:Uncharacterized protein n=1 Tax=Vibrio phage vB_VspP_pVa5 TaxID=1913109 RepID=A0A1J0GV97_9CAUD|nr:hypothetical protein HYP06_gp090 [Vibrio phage vB_VspP_pVa5]APC46102.1 hypothetical protein vBVspPpVa5_0083 [Vibrio phage vB_VspP_pVa5]
MIDAYSIRNGSSYLLKYDGKGWLVDKDLVTVMANPDNWWCLAGHHEEGGEIYVCSAETVKELFVELKMETLMND